MFFLLSATCPYPRLQVDAGAVSTLSSLTCPLQWPMAIHLALSPSPSRLPRDLRKTIKEKLVFCGPLMKNVCVLQCDGVIFSGNDKTGALKIIPSVRKCTPCPIV